MGRSEVPLWLRGLSDRVNAFDLLELDGEDLRGELIEWRKYALAQLLGQHRAELLMSQSIEGPG